MKIDTEKFMDWLRVEIIHENLVIRDSEGGGVYDKLDAVVAEVRSETLAQILNAIHDPQSAEVDWVVE